MAKLLPLAPLGTDGESGKSWPVSMRGDWGRWAESMEVYVKKKQMQSLNAFSLKPPFFPPACGSVSGPHMGLFTKT